MTELQVHAPPAGIAPAPDANRAFLAYLEGARGFFGLLICVLHVWYRLSILRPLSFPLPEHLAVLGHSFVGMFIVMSGYVLGLPVAKNGQRLRGGLTTFATRRARRILPAYYGALAIAIPISLFVLARSHEAVTLRWIKSSLLHLLMLHNFSNGLIETIDSPMWSVAVECDIYVLFPLVLIPLARRFGFVPMIVVGFVLGLVPTLVGALRGQFEHYALSESCFWYIGLFALGYAAANFSVDGRPHVVRRLKHWPWNRWTLIFTILVLVAVVNSKPNELWHGSLWLTDLCAGLAISAQFMADAQARANGKLTWFERFLLLRPLLFLGTFSYSFYLVNFPVIDAFASFVGPNWSIAQVFAAGTASILAALVVAYALYRVLERPFLTAYRRRGDAASLRSHRPAAATGD